MASTYTPRRCAAATDLGDRCSGKATQGTPYCPAHRARRYGPPDPESIDRAAVERKSAKVARAAKSKPVNVSVGQFKTEAECREDALKWKQRPCEVAGCAMPAKESGRCPAHRGHARTSMDDYGPPEEGRCNEPIKRSATGLRGARCRNKAGECYVHGDTARKARATEFVL